MSSIIKYCGDCKIKINIFDCNENDILVGIYHENEIIYYQFLSSQTSINNGYAIDSKEAINMYIQATLFFMENEFEENENDYGEIQNYSLDYTDCNYYIRDNEKYSKKDHEVYRKLLFGIKDGRGRMCKRLLRSSEFSLYLTRCGQ